MKNTNAILAKSASAKTSERTVTHARWLHQLVAGVAFVLFAVGLQPPDARAGVVVTVEQQGADVVISYSGSWDNWQKFGGGVGSDAYVDQEGMGQLPGQYDLYTGLDLMSGNWTTVETFADNVDGDAFGWSENLAYAAVGYSAGTTIEGSLTFLDTDLTTMGFTAGDSGYFEGGGNRVDFSVSGGVAAVPEPSTLALMAMGIGGIYQMKRRRKKAAPTAGDSVSG